MSYRSYEKEANGQMSYYGGEWSNEANGQMSYGGEWSNVVLIIMSYRSYENVLLGLIPY
jgi:hypothetical protein